MALSDAIPTVDGKVICLYLGLALIAFGSGGIKPCVSAFMGDQFRPEQRHLLQKAYAAFYWSINVGSTLSFFVMPYLRKDYGYSWAFGVPGLAMAAATFVFWLGTRRYIMVPPTRLTKTAGFLQVLRCAWSRRGGRKPGQGFWDAARDRFSEAEVSSAKSVGPILAIFALIPVFWSLYEQTFSTWVLQGNQMKPWFVTSTEVKPRHIKQLDPLVAKLTGSNYVAGLAWTQFSPAERDLIVNTNAHRTERERALADGLNRFIAGTEATDPARLAFLVSTQRAVGLRISADTAFLVRSAPVGEDVARAKRLILEDTFADELNKIYRIGPEEMLSVNAIMIMIFIPIMTLVYPRLGRHASPLRRMAYGLFLSASSYVVVAGLQTRIEAGASLSVLWQILPYIILTVAEVLVSATGLEFAFREAAPEMKSIITSFWYLTISFGNLLVSVITALAGKMAGSTSHDVSVSPRMFLFYAGLAFLVAILFSLIATRYSYRDDLAASGR
jgi:dipeptide/tripeptide permease